MRHCKDCEPAQESHFVAYMSVILGWIDEPFFDLMEYLFKNTAETISDKMDRIKLIVQELNQPEKTQQHHKCTHL